MSSKNEKLYSPSHCRVRVLCSNIPFMSRISTFVSICLKKKLNHILFGQPLASRPEHRANDVIACTPKSLSHGATPTARRRSKIWRESWLQSFAANGSRGIVLHMHITPVYSVEDCKKTGTLKSAALFLHPPPIFPAQTSIWHVYGETPPTRYDASCSVRAGGREMGNFSLSQLGLQQAYYFPRASWPFPTVRAVLCWSFCFRCLAPFQHG